MNRLTLMATLLVAFVLVACTSVQDTINSKRNSIVLIVAERVDPTTKKDSSGIGTGFFIAENQILTNAHVIDGAGKVQIKLEDGELHEAEVVHVDAVVDLALVKIKDWEKFIAKSTYSILTLGDSSVIKPMDEVYALGNPWGLLYSVSKGIISHPIRKNDASPKFLIQTDADIYEGNSGGPLLNSDGEVVGINSLMLSREGGSYGFSLHSNIAKKVLKDWETNGEAKWGSIGVSISDDNVIQEVVAGSPAEKAGLKKDDKIVSVKTPAGKFKTDFSVQTIFAIAVTSAPDTVTVTVKRGDTTEEVEITPNYKLSSEFK